MSLYRASDGCRVHYDVVGRGTPVMLIPGLGGDGRFWLDVARHLESAFRLIMVDHRGAGRSDRPEGGYSLPRLAADMAGIMDQEGLRRAHLVGHSTGGAIVQLLALDWPDHVLSCTISSSWCRSDTRFRSLFALRRQLLLDGKVEAYQELTHVLGYTAGWIEAHRRELAEAVSRARLTLSPATVQIARIDMLLEHDVEARIGRISAPTLVIGAEDDALLPLEYSRRIAEAIPGARIATVGGGHFHPRARPEPFAGLVRNFLEAVKENEQGRTSHG